MFFSELFGIGFLIRVVLRRTDSAGMTALARLGQTGGWHGSGISRLAGVMKHTYIGPA